jgi:hypothetical protein
VPDDSFGGWVGSRRLGDPVVVGVSRTGVVYFADDKRVEPDAAAVGQFAGARG